MTIFIKESTIEFIEDMYGIVNAYKSLGIVLPDIKGDNLGYDLNGKVKAFDIDQKDSI